MNRKSGKQKRLYILLGIFLVLGALYAQENQENPAESEKQEPASEAPDPDSDEEKEKRLQALRIRALQHDISTATYLELQELARSLDLNPDLEVESLRDSLYGKFGISPLVKKENNQNDLAIRIESAQEAKAFTVERQKEDSEDYFKVSGGVKVLITDGREGYEHSVQADTITLNRKQDTIRAEGQVLYVRKKLNSKDDKDTERFSGDSLIFRLRVWSGVIFYGVFSRNQKTEIERPADVHQSSSNPEKTKANSAANSASQSNQASLLGDTVLGENQIRYYFDSEKIRKGDDDVLVLEKGLISTSEREQNRYFGLGFHRLWIFGKPEWAMLSATLYVGHIPVMYLPYYYHNDSQILFHPVFGIREAYGEFIQTTTYLLGTPQAASTDSLSFLPVNVGTEKDKDFVLDGFYLVPSTAYGKTKKPESKKTTSKNYLKFLLDYYSYIGLFTGFDAQLKELGLINNWTFTGSIAYAYALEERTGPGFVTGKPYIRGDDGKYSLEVVQGNFLGLPIPFRFGLDTRLRSKNNVLSIDFQYYSDPFYLRDYFYRQEAFDWIAYALERVQRNVDEGDALTELRKKKSLISSYKWKVSLNLQPRLPIFFIDNLSFRVDSSVDFRKKTDTSRKMYEPTREFFYPTQLLLPDTSLRISGTLWPLRKVKKNPIQQVGELPILQDWKYKPPSPVMGEEAGEPTKDESTTQSEGQSEAESESWAIARPKVLAKIPQSKQVQTASFKMTYDLSLQNLFRAQTENENWNRVEDIALNSKELQFIGKEAAQLVTKWQFLDSFLSIDLKHRVDLNVAHYFNITDNGTNSNALEATKQANKWNWTEESNIAIKPLHLFDWFAGSSFTHSIRAILYEYRYNETSGEHEGAFLDFNLENTELRKRISSHRLVSLLDFQPIKNGYNPINNLQASISFTNELPPLEPKNTLKFRVFFEMFHWSHDLSIELLQSGEKDPDYYVQPLTYTSIYKPLEKLEIKNVLIFNFTDAENPKNPQEPYVSKEELSFKAWWFSGGLYFRYTQPYIWDKNNFFWELGGASQFIADKVFASFDLTTKDYYFWKNRLLFYFTFKTRWDQDLIRYNQTSSLTFDFTFSFFIHEFLNIQISYRMSNEKLYLYYPGMKELLGFSHERLFLEDLWHSVSFWDEEKQKQGLFKMKDIRILAIHHLKDWDLIFEFAGKPKQVNNNLRWDYAIGFYLRWIPIPLIKRRATFEDQILKTDAR